MPRRKYNPDGNNEYTSPQEKPPRYDLRRKHKTQDDPIDKKDKQQEEKDMKTSELAKKIARQRIKIAGEVKHVKDTSSVDMRRDDIGNFQLKNEGVNTIVSSYDYLAKAFLNLVKASNLFSKCKSSQISPDGKLGGYGYVQSIKTIRGNFAESMNIISELLDTFYDELNGPHWASQIPEETKQKVNQTDKLIDEAEDTTSDLEENIENKNPNVTPIM